MKHLAALAFLLFAIATSAQKHTYDVELFGKKIGTTVVERIDKGNGEVEFKLSSSSVVNIFFTRKTSVMVYDVVYKNGKLFSSYVKNVKDDVTEIVTILWDGVKYVIKKGEDVLVQTQPIDFSSVHLYFMEPKGISKIFSERLGTFCLFDNSVAGVYKCKLSNGVENIYRYKNGVLY
ncbi:MAG: hypothetical protein JWO06_1732, partial [Bacteroidota bacterium]|nr:hypothetical protein [Bacteroidota bacterium]